MRPPGNPGAPRYRLADMAVNPDPKPGRWILPLVILGMIAFTYFFVRELPGASPETTVPTGAESTTVPEDSSTTVPQGTVDPAVQAYLDQVDAINTSLQAQSAELTAANAGFDAEPRTVEFDDAEARFIAVDTATAELVTQFAALTVPAGFQPNHDVLTGELELAGLAAGDALAGLRSDDPGTLRRNAVEGYVTAAGNFNTEVGNLHTAAGAAPAG
jgi:hypothetical protein